MAVTTSIWDQEFCELMIGQSSSLFGRPEYFKDNLQLDQTSKRQ